MPLPTSCPLARLQALQRRQIAGTSARPVGIAPPYVHLQFLAAVTIHPDTCNLSRRSPTSLNGSDVSSDAEEGCAFSDEEPNFDPYRFDSDDEAPAAPSSSKLSPALTLRRRPRSPSPSPAPSSQEEQLASSQRSFRDHTPPSNPLRRYSRGGRPFREMAPSPETPSRAELIRRGDVVVGCLMEGGKRRRVE